ncbi:5'/3'-nucleotidase SurE, partial [Phocaeicola coprophilus]|nr:5'/3'-nucleotidase SurE [Phocaeicola coprophilus]
VKKAFSIDGRPADCTKLALEVLLKDEQIDMVISGINKGANLGTDVLYSGTVGAALEGYNHKVRSLAVSVSSKSEISFEQIAKIVASKL